MTRTRSGLHTSDQPGTYRSLEVILSGSFDDPIALVFKLNDRELLQQEVGWDENKNCVWFEEKWQPGEYRLGSSHPIELGETKAASGRNNLSVDRDRVRLRSRSVGKRTVVHPKL